MKSEQTRDLLTLFANGVMARSIASVGKQKRVQFDLIYFYIHNRVLLAD